MAVIEAALALWIALVTIAHELSLFSCLLPFPLTPGEAGGEGETTERRQEGGISTWRLYSKSGDIVIQERCDGYLFSAAFADRCTVFLLPLVLLRCLR
jgi:hypothetical protein